MRLSAGVLGLATMVAVGATGCPVPAVFQPEEPTRAVTIPAPSAAPDPALVVPAEGRPRVRVLWRGRVPVERTISGARFLGLTGTHYIAAILGVDPAHHHAYFMRSPLGDEDFFEVVQAPLSAEQPEREPLSRWIGGRDAKYGAFHSFGGDFTADLLRFAAIVEEVGPFVTRTRGGGFGPSVVVSKDAILYEADPDQLLLADRKGGHVRKFVAAAAAYNPLFSADGTAATFTGCHYVPQVPDKLTRCEYHLYIAGPGDRTPARIAEVIEPRAPVFSPDGKYVYAVSRDSGYLQKPYDRGGCLFRVDVALPHHAEKLWCTTDYTDLDMCEDPTGATAVVEGRAGVQKNVVVWLDLPSGRVRNTVMLERAGGLSSLGKHGLLATGAGVGVAVVDLTTGKLVRLDQPQNSETWLSYHWADETSVYAVRQRGGATPTEEILAIDLKAALDAAE